MPGAHFVLSVDRNLFVHSPLGIEPPQCRSIQCSDSSEMCARNVILLRKLQQSGKSLVSLVKDDSILFRWLSCVQQLNLYLGRFARRNGFRRGDLFASLILGIPHQARDPNEHQRPNQSFYFDHSFALPCSRVLTIGLSRSISFSIPLAVARSVFMPQLGGTLI
jgi:hypothetical protein